MFENRGLRRLLGPKTDEMTGDWRKLHNEDVHHLYSSSNIIRMIKSRSMQGVQHAWGDEQCVQTFSLENRKGTDHLEDLGVDGRILNRILKKQCGKVRVGFIWLRIGTDGGSCEHGNEASSTTKGKEFIFLAQRISAFQEGLCSME
jgi:hypothetical protein